MKKTLCLLLCILTVTAATVCASAAGAPASLPDGIDFKGEVGVMYAAYTGGSVLVFDGIPDEAVWRLSPSCMIDASNATLTWSYRSKPNATITSGFLYDEEGLFVRAVIYDPYVVVSDGKNDIHNYDGDYDGEDDCFGYNGDVFILSLDPLNTLDSSEDLRSGAPIWYCISPYSDQTLHVWTGKTGMEDITGSVTGAYHLFTGGWSFELCIPWEVISADLGSLTGDTYSLASLFAPGAEHDAMITYLDRYVYGSGNVGKSGLDPLCFDPQLKIYDHYNPEIGGTFHPKNGVTYTVSRWCTCCTEYTENGETLLGIYGNGIAAKLCGIRLKLDDERVCRTGGKEVIVSPSCSARGFEAIYCAKHGEVIEYRDLGYLHELSDYETVIPATCLIGVEAQKCALCGDYVNRRILPAAGSHATGAPAIHVSARNTDSGGRELYCEDCGETVESTGGTIHLLFTDLKRDSWYSNAVSFCYNNGYFSGVTPRLFRPNMTTTRAMLVQVLAKAADADLSAVYPVPFDDVKAGSWYEKAVGWAYANKITGGVGNRVFAPENAVTREQIALFLMRFAELRGEDVSMRADLSGYTDRAAVSGWAKDAVSWAVAKGLITGTTATTLSPRVEATRATVAVMINNMLK